MLENERETTSGGVARQGKIHGGNPSRDDIGAIRPERVQVSRETSYRAEGRCAGGGCGACG